MSDTMRDAFEAWFYEVENFSMRCERFAGPAEAAWCAWQAAQSQPAPPSVAFPVEPVGYVHPVRLRNLKEGTELSIALVAESEADLREGGDVAVYASTAAQTERPAPPVPQTVQEIMRLMGPYVSACVDFNKATRGGIEIAEVAAAKVNAAYKPLESALTALVDENHRLQFELDGVRAMRGPLTHQQMAKAFVAARISEDAACSCEHHLAIADVIQKALGIEPEQGGNHG